jgi:glycosyltransferase involved in cell wall biosynthesis
MEPAVQRELDTVRKSHGDHVDYRGPVYGEDKAQFYSDVDVVLFPSKMEAQPIVLSEAFAVGKPVIAKALSCIPSLIGESSWTVDPQADYVEFAVRLVEHWLGNPDAYSKASDFAARRATMLSEDAEQKLQDFAVWVSQEP